MLRASSSSISLSTLERLRTHDPQAWTRLSMVFSPLVFHWVLRSGIDRQDAPDIVQEVFRTVAMRIGDFSHRPDGSFRGWLFGITRNKLLAYRKRKRAAPQSLGGSDARRFFDQVAEFEELDFDADEGLGPLCQRAIDLIRNEFSDQAWQAFWRVVVDQRRPDIVARELEISVNSVYLAKSRILRRLRQEIGTSD